MNYEYERGARRLPGKVRRAIRSRYLNVEPRAWIGKNGLSEAVISEINLQLKNEGVIKVEIRKGALISTGMDRKTMAEKVAVLTDSELIDLRGKRFILFKPREGWETYLRRLTRVSQKEGGERKVKPVRKVRLDIAKFRKKFRKGRV
ncbi:MAG: YhbY family RNA-binding protein [Thermococci archaeon]|nr:YhbY family RNA-binding protein [Thermococci archaeon]